MCIQKAFIAPIRPKPDAMLAVKQQYFVSSSDNVLQYMTAFNGF